MGDIENQNLELTDLIRPHEKNVAKEPITLTHEELDARIREAKREGQESILRVLKSVLGNDRALIDEQIIEEIRYLHRLRGSSDVDQQLEDIQKFHAEQIQALPQKIIDLSLNIDQVFEYIVNPANGPVTLRENPTVQGGFQVDEIPSIGNQKIDPD